MDELKPIVKAEPYILSFSADPVESLFAKMFTIRHRIAHDGANAAVGGMFSYEFTPTSVGVAVVVKCNVCNDRLDATNYDSW